MGGETEQKELSASEQDLPAAEQTLSDSDQKQEVSSSKYESIIDRLEGIAAEIAEEEINYDELLMAAILEDKIGAIKFIANNVDVKSFIIKNIKHEHRDKIIANLDKAGLKASVFINESLNGVCETAKQKQNKQKEEFLKILNEMQIVLTAAANGADISYQEDVNSLIEASKKNNLSSVNFFLKKNPLIVNGCDREGNTALHHAAYNGMQDVVKTLIENKADITRCNAKKETALIFAINSISFARTESILILYALEPILELSSEENINQIRETKLYNVINDIFIILAQQGKLFRPEQIKSAVNSIVLMGFDLNTIYNRDDSYDVIKKTPLGLAVQYDNEYLAEILMNAGACPNKKESSGKWAENKFKLYLERVNKIQKIFPGLMIAENGNLYITKSSSEKILNALSEIFGFILPYNSPTKEVESVKSATEYSPKRLILEYVGLGRILSEILQAIDPKLEKQMFDEILREVAPRAIENKVPATDAVREFDKRTREDKNRFAGEWYVVEEENMPNNNRSSVEEEKKEATAVGPQKIEDSSLEEEIVEAVKIESLQLQKDLVLTGSSNLSSPGSSPTNVIASSVSPEATSTINL